MYAPVLFNIVQIVFYKIHPIFYLLRSDELINYKNFELQIKYVNQIIPNLLIQSTFINRSSLQHIAVGFENR